MILLLFHMINQIEIIQIYNVDKKKSEKCKYNRYANSHCLH